MPTRSNPAGERRRRDASRNTGTLIALAALLAVGAGMLALMAIVLPKVVWVLAVVFGFFLVGLFHYVTWGWWLSRVPFEEDEDEE